MKSWKLMVSAVLSCSLLLCGAPNSLADEQGWGMLVRSPQIGLVYVYITPQGFAIVIPKTGAKFVTHAPDWKVVLYNDKTQLYFQERISDLQTVAKGNPRAQKALKKTSMQGAKEGRTIATPWGIKETEYFIQTYSPETGRKTANAWITRDIETPPQFLDTMSKIFNMDTSSFPPGMPLKVELPDESRDHRVIFETLKCERQTIHSASFTYPPHYKRANSELAVIVDEQSRKKMEAILEDSDELNSILGPSSSPPPRTTYAQHQYQQAPARPATTSGYTPKAATATNNNKKSGDWWTNTFNMLGK
jgi:hypothetical protein